MKLKGTITALVTPFTNTNTIDEEGLARNINYQITNGINAILPLGTTGESPTITAEEQERIISIAVNEAKGKVPVMVGTGSYSTQQTIEKTGRAKKLGADAALIVTPYYNRPTQEGIYRHFEAVATSVNIPIMVYNIPGRCGANIETATLLRIAELPNIIGLKDATGNVLQAGDVIDALKAKRPDFVVFSGDDALTLPMMALGAAGVISVVSNIIPAQISAQVNAALEGNFRLAREIHYQLLPLYKAAFIETNPVPIKTAMKLVGMPAGECRLPLCSMSEENVSRLIEVLERMGLMNFADAHHQGRQGGVYAK